MAKCGNCGEEGFMCEVEDVSASGIFMIFKDVVDIEITQMYQKYQRTSDWTCIECNTVVSKEDSKEMDELLDRG